jgi:hypothetical protein
MLRIFLLLLLCVSAVGLAVTASDARYFIVAAAAVLLALRDVYYLGKGQMLTEGELPKVTYQVVYELCRNGHTIVAVLTKKGKLLVCISDGVYFSEFKLWGSGHRVLTPIFK